jgi:hypothetical protein
MTDARLTGQRGARNIDPTHRDRPDSSGAGGLQCPEEAIMSQVTRRLGRILAPTTVVHAHCDVPCGIYDPAGAAQAARTVARMV